MTQKKTNWLGSQSLAWYLFAIALVAAPWMLGSPHAILILSHMGIAIIACLSYNMLFGQAGMLSFGHAMYTGCGAYAAIHLLNAVSVSNAQFALPVSLIPLAAGFISMGFAALTGFVSTRKSGTSFAMITLGLGELVFAASLMFPAFFGGEAGLSGNRVAGPSVLGISFGPQMEVYYLIALYTFVCVAAMYAFTLTPLARLVNAVRDNAERVEFIGYSARHVRLLVFVIAGFFAGIAGGLAALNLEIVSPDVFNPVRSASYLLFTFLGGATIFFGPIIGAVLMVMASAWLPAITSAWMLYLGLIFIWMVMDMPRGLAGVVLENLRVARAGLLHRLLPAYLGVMTTAWLVVVATAALIEMLYQVRLGSSKGSPFTFLGLEVQVHNMLHWLVAIGVLLQGAALFGLARRALRLRWNWVCEHINLAEKRVEASDPCSFASAGFRE